MPRWSTHRRKPAEVGRLARVGGDPESFSAATLSRSITRSITAAASGPGRSSNANSEAPPPPRVHPGSLAPKSESLAQATAMPPPPEREDDEPHRVYHSGAAAFVGLCVGVVLLLVSGCLLVNNHPTGTSAAATTALRTSAPSAPAATSTVRTTTQAAAAPPVKTGIGVTFGKVVANDGTTMVVRNAFTSSSVKVRADADTKVNVLVAKRAPDIRVGAIVAVYGRQYPDHTIVAEIITGISIGAPSR
ncbi:MULTISPECIES: hypothetical protein [unclassified Nocardia]|uniref:hypothetical protein n=1 Tax=Nocardia sp. NPDC019255 TaxID=3154591 RepID=UPI00340D82F0